jgi:hypothetical protein
MSHITTVETEIRDREVLVRTLEKLGILWEEDRWVRYHHDRLRMDIVIGRSRGAGTGFRRPGPGQAFQMHGWGSGGGGSLAWKGRILQEYARLKVLKEARKRNFGLVQETVCSGNRIRLVLRKVSGS